MGRFFKKFEKVPLTDEEWREVKMYQRLPFDQKLALLDRHRSFIFEVWKQNPRLYRTYLKFNPK